MIQRHGIIMGMERIGKRIMLSFKAIGKLTHEDYETITPLMQQLLESVKPPKVRMLFDAREFEGWEPRAAWDDLKLGLKYGNEFEKIAVVGRSNWMEMFAKVASWFTQGEIRFFDQMQDALEWLHN